MDVVVEVPSNADAVPAVHARLNEEIDVLNQYASAQGPLITEFNRNVATATRQVLQARLSHLDTTKAAVSAIAVPLLRVPALRGT